MIEFLDLEPDGPPPKEEPAPRSRRDWLRRLWLPVTVVALLVVALLTIDDTPGRRATPQPTNPPPRTLAFLDYSHIPEGFAPYGTTSFADEVRPLRGIPDLRSPLLPDGRLPCPAESACYFSRAIPTVLDTALHEAFPKMEPARALTLNTQATNQPLTVSFRQIYLASDTLDVTIRVVRPAGGELGFHGIRHFGTRTVDYVVEPNSGYAVIVHVEGPTGEDVQLSRLLALARDDRLFAPQA